MPTPVFSNPSAADYVTQSFEFARFKQYLTNAGDIFEAPVGCRAIALGPDSDVSRVTIAYFDPQAPDSNMQLATITPGRAWSAPLNAPQITGAYQPSNVPGRILFWASEKYDSSFSPGAVSVIEPPVIDILQYFSDPPEAIEGQRADKEYYYARFRSVTNGSIFSMIPFYGRKFATIQIEMSGADPANPATILISGLDFQISQASFPLTTLIASFTMADGDATQQIIRAQTHGLHDYLHIRMTGGALTGTIEPLLFRVRVSDEVI